MTETKRTKYSISRMSQEEVCKTLGILDLRTLLTSEKFPRPFFDEDKLWFNKKDICKYFNVDNMDEPFITLKEAAEYLDIHCDKLARLSLIGEIPNYRLKNVKGSGYLFRKSELKPFSDINLEGNVDFVNYYVGNELLRELLIKLIDSFQIHYEKRDYDIICKHFLERRSFVSISKEMGLSRERIRQIVGKAIKRIKYNTYYSPMEYVKLQRKIAQQELEIKYLKNVKGIKDKRDFNLSQENLDLFTTFLRGYVSDLDISVRAKNCINNAGIETVKDLVCFCYKDNFKTLRKLRNAGKKSVDEVKELISEERNKLKNSTGIDLQELIMSNVISI